MSQKKTNGLSTGSLDDAFGQIDTKREAEGVWFGHEQIQGFEKLLLDENGNGLRAVKVMGKFTAAYTEEEQAAQSRALQKSDDARFPYLIKEGLRLNAKHCFADWDFTDRQGRVIPFSEKAVNRIYMEKGEKGILKWRNQRSFMEASIVQLHQEIEAQKESDVGESAGGSEETSSGEDSRSPSAS